MFGHINISYIHRKYKRDDNGNLRVELGEITGMSGTLLLFEGICGHWNGNFTLRGHLPTN